jgi:O-antigen ligase
MLIVANIGYFQSVFVSENDESGGTRMAAWEVNRRVTGKHLIFGTGPAGYADYYMSYYPKDAMATHNNIIDILAQTGIIGLGLCLWFFFRLAWLGYNLCLRLRGRRDFVEALANAAFAGTVGCIVMMIFGDWLFPFTYTQTIAGFDYVVYSWLFMGAILVIDRLTPANLEAVGNA